MAVEPCYQQNYNHYNCRSRTGQDLAKVPVLAVHDRRGVRRRDVRTQAGQEVGVRSTRTIYLILEKYRQQQAQT